MSFEEYKIETGEPAGIQPKIWNGELSAYQREQLKKLYKMKDPKKIQAVLVEVIKSTYHIEDELRKANFYKQEFESMCNFLENHELLHETKTTQRFTDEFGKEHDHTMNVKRSLVKSVPAIRAAIQGN